MKTDWTKEKIERLIAQVKALSGSGIIADVARTLDIDDSTVADVLSVIRPQRRVDVIAIYDESVRLIKLRGINFE